MLTFFHFVNCSGSTEFDLDSVKGGFNGLFGGNIKGLVVKGKFDPGVEESLFEEIDLSGFLVYFNPK